MTPSADEPTRRGPLRLWPGVAIAALQLLVWFLVPLVVPGAALVGVAGGMAGGLAIAMWWLFLSRAPWPERLGAVVLMVAALAATQPFLHESIATGAMGFLFFMLAVPVLGLAFVAWAVGSRRLAAAPRRASMIATILIACGAWTLARTGGFTGDFDNDLAWRWTPTPEQRLLADAGSEPAVAPPVRTPAPVSAPASETSVGRPGEPDALPAAPANAAASASPAPAMPEDASDATAPPPLPENAVDWPGFRGPARDGIIRGARISVDWSATPPIELWRRAIGPGWSSFAVRNDLVYTQEQRGDDEMVTAYALSTGEPVWRHRDQARFWESNGGAGPRATPTLSGDRVYTFGATGILNALDAGTGAVAWARDVAADTQTAIPDWGFSSSPLVFDDLVIVAAAGSLAAYDTATGRPRWTGPNGGDAYSSPHLATIDGVVQVLLISAAGAVGVSPADGTVLWEHLWQTGTRIVQPALTDDGDLLLGAEGALGMRRVGLAHVAGKWTTTARWTSNRLKPYFSDFVVHEGHAYGFDGSILASVSVADGSRAWKGGRYGQGQLVLLPDQDLLLVLSEDGDLALVRATPDGFTEVARVPALEGKTWNHPVVVGDRLLVRNGQEMVAFRLPVADE